MRKQEVEKYKKEYEDMPKSFYSFGADLIDAGSPNPCSRSGAARKVLTGRWKEAYQIWLDDGEYSRLLEEPYVGFILASEKIVNKGPSAPVPDLPKRIWDYAEYNRALRRFEDMQFRNKTIAHLLQPGRTEWCKQRFAIGTLVQQNKWQEAERLYNEFEWREDTLAESGLALIHSCVHAEPENLNQSAMWYYYQPGKGVGGPIHYEKLKNRFLEISLTDRCLVWREGMTEWTLATSLKTFKSVVYCGPKPPPLPPGS